VVKPLRSGYDKILILKRMKGETCYSWTKCKLRNGTTNRSNVLQGKNKNDFIYAWRDEVFTQQSLTCDRALRILEKNNPTSHPSHIGLSFISEFRGWDRGEGHRSDGFANVVRSDMYIEDIIYIYTGHNSIKFDHGTICSC